MQCIARDTHVHVSWLALAEGLIRLPPVLVMQAKLRCPQPIPCGCDTVTRNARRQTWATLKLFLPHTFPFLWRKQPSAVVSLPSCACWLGGHQIVLTAYFSMHSFPGAKPIFQLSHRRHSSLWIRFLALPHSQILPNSLHSFSHLTRKRRSSSRSSLQSSRTTRWQSRHLRLSISARVSTSSHRFSTTPATRTVWFRFMAPH